MTEKANPVNWFEIPVNDLDRARAFYEYVFEMKLDLNEMDESKMAWFPMMEATGTTGTLIKVKDFNPSHDGTLIYFSVDDIDETLKRITNKGGKILTPRTSIGEYGFTAIFEDSEGNKIALHSNE
ncbi:MAG TPA: VOC family protein [Balneolales bacterium]|nr:VOC family protein [Balneolales bacterium]